MNIDSLVFWPNSIKITLLSGVCILIILTSCALFISPNFKQYAVAQSLEIQLKKTFEFQNAQGSCLPAYQKQIHAIKHQLGWMLEPLPEKNEMPGLLEDISKTGIACGLKFELFAPQSEISHDFYIELPIEMTVQGTYKQLALFMSRIAEMNRMVTVHDFNIAKIDFYNHKKVSGDALIMHIRAKIYRYFAP